MKIHPTAIVLGWLIGSALALLAIWLFPILSRPISAPWKDSAPSHTETLMDGALDSVTGHEESPIP